jgi:outer membrane scaffolding protein for murein synthesis (MipA/OmpV family)
LRSCTTSKGDKMNRIAWTGVLAASACLLLTATAASAEDASSTPGDPGGLTFLGWRLNHARVGLGMEPDYLGSNDYRVVPSGSLSFARRGGKAHLWSAPDDGFNVGLVSGDTLSAGLVGRWRSGRTDRNDLRGFDKIGGTIEAGGFVNWWPAEWLRVRGEARHGIGGHDSWSADLGADAVGRTGARAWPGRTRISPQPISTSARPMRRAVRSASCRSRRAAPIGRRAGWRAPNIASATRGASARSVNTAA